MGEVVASRRSRFAWGGIVLAGMYATGIVEPSVMLPIVPRGMGYLKTLEVDEGSVVYRNQVLARLEATDLHSSVNELVAHEGYARAQYQRMEQIVQRRLAAVAELDRARSDWQAARAALDRARAQLEFMTLRAPTDGVIIRRDGEVGQFIAAGQAVFHLSTTAPLRVTAEVDEEDAPRVQAGQPVVLRADALPGGVFDGVVAEMTPKGDPVARSYRVRINLGPVRDFKIGMTVDANIIIAKHDDVWLIPATALRDGVVWTIVGGRLRKQTIKTGVIGGQLVEVQDGLDGRATVVAEPIEGLREGRRVWVRSP